MKHPFARLITLFALFSAAFARGNSLYVDLNSANPTPPYSDWTTAATNIQDAIDASTDGDQIWVTNGVYQTGGKVMAGNLTNRVALYKAVTVQSVNGPFVTTIAGIGATNNGIATRCAWLTNNAALIGFTLTRGATRSSGDPTLLESGGAVWCASPNALVSGCLIRSNTAFFRAGGAFQGTLNNCLISSNSVFISQTGGAAYSAVLNNCTVISNSSGGCASCQSTNSICYYNDANNYSGGNFSYSCVTPAAAGTGNFTNAPIFFVDRIHLAIGSPGIGAGTTPITGLDIFGKTWGNPPSVGCAETAGPPNVSAPQMQLTNNPVGFKITGSAFGDLPLTYSWSKDSVLLQNDGHFVSTQSNNLVATSVSFADAGNYQLIVSNAFGMTTSAVAKVIIHCVNIAGTNPVSPYTSWNTAATNIQDAISSAATNEIVLVTNGIYATGGKSMDNIITNRVSIDKLVLVQSVNGASATVIQGSWDPNSTNGPAAVRCVWMTNNSILNGFTIVGGATRASNTFNASLVGGGILASSNNAVVWNCMIRSNYASYFGGGAFSASLFNCSIMGNNLFTSPGGANQSGGGAMRCILRNCLVANNTADQSSGGGADFCQAVNCAFLSNRAVHGGAIDGGNYVNCTIKGNTTTGSDSGSAAVISATLVNSIVIGNFNNGIAPTNYVGCTFSFSDSAPLPPGTGNINVDPQLMGDSVHLASTSPCLGAGTSAGLTGADIDNQPWNNPPAMGCDEWQPMPIIGIQPAAQAGFPSRRALSLPMLPVGQSPFSYFWFKDGTLVEDSGHYGNSTTSNLLVNNFQPEDSGLYQLILSNSFGVVTSQLAHVVIHAVDSHGNNPSVPYSTWQTAATNIQDAVDAASSGDIVLVTDGVYLTGGKVMSGDLTNRVALDKPIITISVNGYSSTVIEGQFDPATNGPAAVRCAWLANGATLSGFTLRNGATRGGSQSVTDDQRGGGAWLSTNALISNCVITNNSASYNGGGVAFGTVNNSFLGYNFAFHGGGAYSSHLNNCTVRRNYFLLTFGSGAGVESCISRNCIITENYDTPFQINVSNFPSSPTFDRFTNCCTSPLPSFGANNINVNPQFLDYGLSFALAPASPCRGAGNSLFSGGFDLDGEPFLNPPAIGCDEMISTNLTGPLSFSFLYFATNTLVNHRIFFATVFEGRASELDWTFGDGTVVTNEGGYTSHTWTNTGTYMMTLTAYNVDHPEGVSSNLMVTIQPFLSPTIQVNGLVSNSFQFTFAAQGNGLYQVQYATNLTAPVTWKTLPNFFFFSNTGSVATVQDPAITNGVRFYRVFGQ